MPLRRTSRASFLLIFTNLLKCVLKETELKPKVKKVEEKEVVDDVIKVGDSVFMADMQITGDVLSINGNDVTIGFNSVSFKTHLSKLVKISKKEAREVRRSGIVHVNEGTLAEAMNKKLADFNSTLDVRGQRVEEMLPVLHEYLDEAALLSIRYVRILHGKGNGILRQVIRQHLHKRSDVEDFQDEALELGGCGITVVKMKN